MIITSRRKVVWLHKIDCCLLDGMAGPGPISSWKRRPNFLNFASPSSTTTSSLNLNNQAVENYTSQAYFMVVVQLMSTHIGPGISCTTTTIWPNLCNVPMLVNNKSVLSRLDGIGQRGFAIYSTPFWEEGVKWELVMAPPLWMPSCSSPAIPKEVLGTQQGDHKITLAWKQDDNLRIICCFKDLGYTFSWGKKIWLQRRTFACSPLSLR